MFQNHYIKGSTMKGLPVQGAPFQHFPNPMGFHKVYAGITGPIMRQRYSDPHIFRHLADRCSKPVVSRKG